MANPKKGEATAQVANPDFIGGAEDWDKVQGEEFGGKSEILLLEIGQVSKPLTYLNHQNMTTSLGETTVHLAQTVENESVRLPIQATFLRAVDQANLKRGDRFIVKRFDDVKKKAGKGAGNDMAIYGIKVVERGPKVEVDPFAGR